MENQPLVLLENVKEINRLRAIDHENANKQLRKARKSHPRNLLLVIDCGYTPRRVA